MRLAAAAGDFNRLDVHASVTLRKSLDAPSPSHLNSGERLRVLVQNRLEIDLTEAMLRLGSRPTFIQRSRVLARRIEDGGRFRRPRQ